MTELLSRRDAERLRNAKRSAEKPWRQWYKTREWYAIRQRTLRDNPICQRCHAEKSAVVDHTERHNGDRLKFFSGPFMALCKHCHDSWKQSVEFNATRPKVSADGWPPETSMPKGWVSWEELHKPSDIGPSKPPLTIVCGPPASGKTTYVRANAAPADFRVDADIEADRFGINRYTPDGGQRVQILKARNDALRSLATIAAPAAWFTTLAANPAQRSHWANKLKAKQVVVLLTPAEVCVERIRKTRKEYQDEMIASVGRWYERFSPRGGELILRDFEIGGDPAAGGGGFGI